MKRNELHHDYGWMKGLAWFLLGAAGVSLWWSLGTSRMEHRMPDVSPQSQLELPRTVAPTETAQTPKGVGPTAKVARHPAESYWVEATGEGIMLIPKPIEVAGVLSQETALKLAFDELLQGSTEMGFSAIPAGTRLLALEVQPSGVYVNLSREFGSGGGSTSMIERVGQVIFTASSVNPDEAVMLAVEGKLISPDNPLGGEGLILDQPITRSQYVAQFPLY